MKVKLFLNKRFKIGLKSCFLILLLITCILYCRLDYMGHVRESRVDTALKNNLSVIEIIKYPKSIEHIQWASNFVEKDTYLERYKLIKNIPKNKKTEVIEFTYK